jgi:protein-disulfide isomerase
MVTNDKLQITIVSGACCSPHQARFDTELEANLIKAAAQAGITFDLQTVSLTAVLENSDPLSEAERAQIQRLFQKAGVGSSPAVLFNKKVQFAGGVPSVEQLQEAFTK